MYDFIHAPTAFLLCNLGMVCCALLVCAPGAENIIWVLLLRMIPDSAKLVQDERLAPWPAWSGSLPASRGASCAYARRSLVHLPGWKLGASGCLASASGRPPRRPA